MGELDESGQRLLAILVEHMPKVKPGEPQTYITYKGVHDRLELHQNGETWGESLQAQGLNSLADWTKRMGFPGITGIITNGGNVEDRPWQPGVGYFDLFKRPRDDFRWWREEVDRAKAFDWLRYLSPAAIDTQPTANIVLAAVGQRMPLPPSPTEKHPVRELVALAGIDVSDWAYTQDGKPIGNPNDNIGRNTMWSFVGRPPEPIALCVWFEHVDWKSEPPTYRGNEYPYQRRLSDIANTRKGKDGLSRLKSKLRRSRAFHDAVFVAYRDSRPIRMILVDGEEIPIEEAADDASKVTAREIDPEHWYVHSFDGITGEYVIVRGVECPKSVSEPPTTQYDPLDDPVFSSYLASIEDTERDAAVKIRVCQGIFRDALIQRWGGCSVTKCGLKEVLVASHIRPWSRCETAEQRLSPANGLLLTPNLDKLFDTGLISFDDRFRIVFSPLLKEGWALMLGIRRDMHLSNHARADLLPYLRWHREHILKC